MLAVLLMALLAAAAALTFAEPMRRARARDAEERVRSFDAASRQYARRFGCEVAMGFDLSTGALSRREGNHGGRVGYRGTLPGGCRIEQVSTAGRAAYDGEVVLRCSAAGAGRSYAVHLVGPGLDRWLLAAGLSGEISEVRDEAEADRVLRATTSAGGVASSGGGAAGDDAD